MGNCQAIDTAALVIQHPNGKADKLYSPVKASEVMKTNPGYYVALLITTSVCHTQSDKSNAGNTKNSANNNNNDDVTGRCTVRITRVKLLRSMDTLALGHVYRLISTKDVMKGLVAKKQAKMRKNGIELADSEGLLEAQKVAKKTLIDNKTHQVSRHGHRSRTTSSANGATIKPKTWQPSLNSISEFAS